MNIVELNIDLICIPVIPSDQVVKLIILLAHILTLHANFRMFYAVDYSICIQCQLHDLLLRYLDCIYERKKEMSTQPNQALTTSGTPRKSFVYTGG